MGGGLRERRNYNGVFERNRQRSVIVNKDVNVALNGSKDGNEPMRCSIAAPIKLFSTL